MMASPRDPRRGAWPWGLIGMMALAAAVELFVGRHEVDFTSPCEWGWRLGGAAARREAPGCEVLCFGDSLVQYGVIPRVIEARLGGKVYNLALGGGRAASSYFQLRRALDRGAAPRALLVDFLPMLLASDPRQNVRQWPELVDSREAIDLARTARDAGLFAEVMLARLLPSVKDRFEIRAGILAALRGESASQREHVANVRRNLAINDGALIMPDGPPQGDPDVYRGWVYPEGMSFQRAHVAYVRRFLELAESRQIPVFWLLTPVHPELQARCERGAGAATQGRWVRALQARFPNLVVLDGRRSGYAAAAFHDPIHLNRRGALAFSADVADLLAAHLSGAPAAPRWVALPPYRERPAGGPLEDLGESSVALRARRGDRLR